jgi:hypothetical protein
MTEKRHTPPARAIGRWIEAKSHRVRAELTEKS